MRLRAVEGMVVLACGLVAACFVVRATAAGPSVATVSRVLDGATVQLVGGRSVRIFGVSAPRPHACFGLAAKDTLARALRPGDRVVVRARASGPRLVLAEITRGTSSLGVSLVSKGVVAPLQSPGMTATERSRLLRVAQGALRARRGLWGACPDAKLDPSRPVRTGSGPVGGTVVFRLGAAWKQARGYGRYAYIVVSRGPYAPLAARQPGKSLVYHSAASVNSEWNSGVPYAEARSKGWLLTDTRGALLRNAAYPENAVADVGDRAFQKAWIDGVTRYVESIGADGVFLDDVIADLGQLTRATYATTYPTGETWEEAMVSFVAAVGRALHARGLYLLVNANAFVVGNSASDDGSLVAAWWRRLAPSIDGLLYESMLQAPTDPARLRSEGSAWHQNWEGWLRLVSVAQSAGRDFFGLTYGEPTFTRAMRYARASFLLAWDGSGGGVGFHTPTGDPWHADWTTSIGMPLAPRSQVGRGWRRDFSAGVALVNPSPEGEQAFDLGGPHRTPDGAVVTRVVLEPTSGLVARRVG